MGVQQVATTNQLVGTTAVENGARIDFRGHPESNPCGEVGFDDPRNDIDRRALGGDNQMNPNGTGQLGQASDRGLYFFSRSHDQVGKLIHHQNNVG